ncbi:MAG TPA: FAD-dependent oxidoreductase [Candidatus Scatomorpha gallistercoris]|nr:FAD-dependent oxidoreductase [Candidatus Scatomorpha gallistercoris]
MRASILKLATKISIECGTYTGVTPNDPEYKILDPVITDEMAEIAMGLKVRKYVTAEQVAKKVKKPLGRVKEVLDELTQIGVCRCNFKDGEDKYFLPIWVPGIMEMMVGNKELCERYPVIAECFEEYTRRRIAPLAPFIPVGQGMMRVIPVEMAIQNDAHRGTYEEIHQIVDNSWAIAVTDCSCRRTRRLMGEGCGHLEKDVCIFFNESAEYHIRTGHGRKIDRDECYEILKRCEENGLVHEISNLDAPNGAAAICNCCGCSCFSLRIAEYLKTPDVIRSNYVAEVDASKCVACGLCVENCNLGALKLGQKLCATPSRPPEHKTPHDKLLWFGEDNYDKYYRTNRGYTAEGGTAPCKTRCPAHIPVQGYIKLASQGRFDEALELIRRENPFPAVCGRVCPRFCEEACSRGDVDAPVAIDEVKKFLAQRELDPATRVIPKMLNTTGKPFTNRIAVVGSGPAGLSCAYYLALQGYPVTVFEKQKTVGGMLTNGIPSFRLEKDVVAAEIDILREIGVEFKTGVEVGKDVTLDELRREGYQAFFLAIGAWKAIPLGIPGESYRGVMSGLELLRRAESPRPPAVSENTVIVGGGNVAIDAARAALRLGAKNVTVVYRRAREDMPADAEEVAEAEAEGVAFKFLVSPIRIKGSDGKATELELQVMAQGEADGAGRRKSVPVEGQTETIPAGTVVAAIGQRVDWGDMLAGSRVQLRRSGAAMADRVTLQTMEPDIFVGGDALTGPSFVIDAIAEGKEAAISIHRYVQPGQSLTIGRRVKDYMELDKSEADLAGYDRAPRQHTAEPDHSKARETFRDLRGTFTAEQVLKETERCLGCGATVVDQSACVGCGVCTTKCKFDAIRLVRVTDSSGKAYEKLMPESGKNLARRVKEIAVKRVARPRSK